ncbi:hypothetical protein [Dyella silvatica]|uniref:hypothetical protein n=1 Tax=Dyella silvatica TaxID=2992128 RepID=UPI0022527CE3|nr:hypothetical protein [Dyella silvatica]
MIGSVLVLWAMMQNVHASVDEAERISALTVAPGRTVCQSHGVIVAGKTVKGSLCVSGEDAEHDVYSFGVAESKVLSGADDLAEKGLSGSYEGRPLSMLCTPVSRAADGRGGMMTMPGKGFQSERHLATDKAREPAVQRLTAVVAHRCVVKLAEQTLMTVLVQVE